MKNKKFLNHYKLLSGVESEEIMQFIGGIEQPQKNYMILTFTCTTKLYCKGKQLSI